MNELFVKQHWGHELSNRAAALSAPDDVTIHGRVIWLS